MEEKSMDGCSIDILGLSIKFNILNRHKESFNVLASPK